MSNEFSMQNIRQQMLIENAKQKIIACNSISERYGLALSEAEIKELMECRITALKNTGRVEFGNGILPKLIYSFCDSPYMEQDNYSHILAELQDAFYNFKNDSEEQFSDDEIIEYMVNIFNGKAQGSVEYLTQLSIDSLYRYGTESVNPFHTANFEEAGDLF